MKNASKVRLSLRKLFIAMLAVGPLAILPAPIWAVIPTQGTYSVGVTPAGGSFTMNAGTVTVSASGNVANINTSDRAVLQWNAGQFTIGEVGVPQTWNFILPAGGAVLNRVGNATATVPFTDTALVRSTGTLLSNGKIFILANGAITLETGATINTQGGLVLSTVREDSDGPFQTLNDLTYNGTATGPITIGTLVAPVTGNFTAVGSTISSAGSSFSGDVILRSITAGAGIDLAATNAAGLTAGGTLSVTTNNGTISATNLVTVGLATSGNQTATLNAGAAAINLANSGNDFEVLAVTSTGTAAAGNVTIRDANIITLAGSTVGNDLSVTVGGKTSTTSISTSGAVVVGGNASFVSASSANASVSFASGSSIVGWASAVTSGGSVTINTTGNLTLGNITTNVTATSLAGASYASLLSGPATLTSGSVTAVALTAGTTSPIYPGNVSLTFTSPIAAATAPALTGSAVTVAAATVTNAGGGYTGSAPTATVIGGGGSGATASVTVTGDVVTGVTITAGGTGYTSVPTIIINHPNANAVAATGTAIRNGDTGLVTSVDITSGGLGYGVTAPTVTYNAVATDQNFSSGSITGISTGTITTTSAGLTNNAAVGSPIYSTVIAGLKSGSGAALTGTTVTNSEQISTRTGANTATSLTSTAGGITIGASITSNRVIANSSAAGGNITQTAGVITTNSNSTTATVFNAGTTTGTVDVQGLNLIATGAPTQITAGNAAIRNARSITVGTSNVTGNLTVRADPDNATAASVTLGTGSGVGGAQNITVGGNLTVYANGSGTITDNNESAFNVFGALNLQTGVTGAVGAEVQGTGGVITLDAVTIPGVLNPSVRFGQVNATTGAVGVGGAAISIAETTTINLGTITGSSLTATSTQGGIVDSGIITLTGTGTFITNATNSIVLDSANIIPTLAVSGNSTDASITGLNADVTIDAGTIMSSGNLTVGTAATKNIAIGAVGLGSITNNTKANLTVNSGGWIDVTGAATINGNLSLTATANIASPATTLVNSAATFASIIAANVTVTSTSNITDATGKVIGIGSSDNRQVLSFAPGVATVAVGLQGVVPVAGATAPTVVVNQSAMGQITGFNITAGGFGYNTGIAAPTVTLGGATNTSITQSGGTLNVTGTTSIASPGNALLFRGNDFNNVVLANSTGGALVNDINNLTISGNAAGTVTARAGANSGGTVGTSPLAGEANAWSLTIGQINVGSLIAVASNGGSGNSGTITQTTGTRIHSENLASFNSTNNNIVIGNNGNNFGRVEVTVSSTDGSRTVTVVEDGTMKLGTLNSRGNTTLTSRFGSIIEDPAANVTVTQNGTLTANAVNGSILLGNTTHTAGTTGGNLVTVIANAPQGAVAFQSSANLTLGNVTALSIIATSGSNIAQSSGSRIAVFGASNFTAVNNITLSSETNNFGRVSLTTTSANTNIAVTESGTLNIGTVAMGDRGMAATTTVPVLPATPAVAGSGNFTATSVNGDIIDTGLGGAKFGGLIAPSGSSNAGTLLSGTGVVTLNATNGNIVLDDPTTDFHTVTGVVFAARNVTLAPLGGTSVTPLPIRLGAPGAIATATNLEVRSAIGSITNGGPITVTDDAYFQTGNSNITLNDVGNRFGTVRFSGNQVRITQTNDINIVTGSSALGLAEFVSGSYIAITNRGGSVTFGSTANFTAAGSITLPKLLQAAGTLTVNAAGTKDLSALSISADLAGRTPLNLGTGTYLPPQP